MSVQMLFKCIDQVTSLEVTIAAMGLVILGLVGAIGFMVLKK